MIIETITNGIVILGLFVWLATGVICFIQAVKPNKAIDYDNLTLSEATFLAKKVQSFVSQFKESCDNIRTLITKDKEE